MTSQPLVAGGAYFAVVLGLGEIARRGIGVAPDVTRKAVLLAISLWSVPALYLFDERRLSAAAFAGCALLLYLSFRFEILAALEDEGPGLGSVLSPLSVAVLVLWLGEGLAHVALAAVLATGIGDGAAALVGRRRGTRKYRFLGHARTMEGTLAMFLGASIAAAPALAALGGVDWHQAVAFALIAGTVAASVESVSIHGTDNVTVPLATAATIVVLLRTSA